MNKKYSGRKHIKFIDLESQIFDNHTKVSFAISNNSKRRIKPTKVIIKEYTEVRCYLLDVPILEPEDSVNGFFNIPEVLEPSKVRTRLLLIDSTNKRYMGYICKGKFRNWLSFYLLKFF